MTFRSLAASITWYRINFVKMSERMFWINPNFLAVSLIYITSSIASEHLQPDVMIR